MKYLIAMIISVLMIGCSSSKKNNGQVRMMQEPTPPQHTGIPVIVSQDTFDSDNFSLIYIAKKLNDLGKIRLLAVDVTGKDTGDKGGLLFSTMLFDTDIPVLINHGDIKTRVTPSSQIFKQIDNYANDGLLDSQRTDSTLELAAILETSDEPVIYVSGGHLNNLASLMKYNIDLVRTKIKAVVIATGWSDRIAGKPEMNLSEGQYKSTGTSEATKYVFANMPPNVKIVIPSDPSAIYKKLPVSIVAASSPLYYFITKGHYANGKTFDMGDFEALLYAAAGTNWYGNKWADEVNTCFHTTNYGAVTVSNPCNKNHYYLDNVNTNIEKSIFEELLK